MFRCIFCLFCSIVFFLNFVPSANAKRLALVIGNDTYPNLGERFQLERAKNDARDVGKALKKLGFKVIEGFDLSRSKMNRKIALLSGKISPGDEVVFFYAGHGVGIDGQNFLIPVNVPKFSSEEEDLVKDESIRVGRVVERFKKRGARINLFFLDACRDNPFTDTKGRSIGRTRGLNAMSGTGEGTMVVFSAGVGQSALDSLAPRAPDSDQNSVFTRSLIPLLLKPGLEIKALANEVRKNVYLLSKSINHNQRPASYNEIIDDYFLAGRSITVEPARTSSTRKQDEFDALKKQVAELKAQIKARPEPDREIEQRKAKSKENPVLKPTDTKTQKKTPPKQKSQTKSGTKVAIGVFPQKRLTKKTRFVHGYKFDDCDSEDWCPKMIMVRGGVFSMGSQKREVGRKKSEGPRRRVRINNLAVGRYEVTVNEWKACEADGACKKVQMRHDPETKGNYPVTGISWDYAKSYVKWLSEKTGQNYRLLTEAEWEYIASARRTTLFWWGSSISIKRARYDGAYNIYGRPVRGAYDYDDRRNEKIAGSRDKVPVNKFRPNPFGLYNVHGNAAEWVEDCWHSDYRNAPKDGSAWLEDNGGECVRRITRGGDRYDKPSLLRSRSRGAHYRFDLSAGVGLRVARDL